MQSRERDPNSKMLKWQPEIIERRQSCRAFRTSALDVPPIEPERSTRPFDAVWRRRAFLVSAVVFLAALASERPIRLGPAARPLAALHDCGHNL
jgi:hypothetical protein